MEDIGNWVYIVAIVGTAIVSMFKKKNKEVQTPLPRKRTPVESEPWPWVMPQVAPIEEKAKKKPTVQPIAEEGKRVFGTFPSIVPTETASCFTQEEEKHFDFALDLEETNELKKGLIYAEILNRKYF